HALIHETTKGLQDAARGVVAARRQSQARQRDHGVASPVTKPRVARDHRFAVRNIWQRTRKHEAVGSKDQLIHPCWRCEQLGYLHVCAPQLSEVASLRAPQCLVEVNGGLWIEACDNPHPLARMQRERSLAYAQVSIAIGQTTLALHSQIEVLVPVVTRGDH